MSVDTLVASENILAPRVSINRLASLRMRLIKSILGRLKRDNGSGDSFSPQFTSARLHLECISSLTCMAVLVLDEGNVIYNP